MGNVNFIFKFLLENGKYGDVTIKDVDENASNADIKALSDTIIAKNTKINGQKPTELVVCTKSITTLEDLDI